MSLFQIHTTEKNTSATENISCRSIGAIQFIQEKQKLLLDEVIGELKMNEHIHFFTKNSWTVPDLVLYILSQTGKANVFIASWAMKEFPARRIVKAKQENLIEQLHIKLDHRVKTYDNQVYHFLQKNADTLVLAHCHAKVTVIENKEWGVVITGSANYSANPRAEAGVISCDKKVAQVAKNWILNIDENNLNDGMD